MLVGGDGYKQLVKIVGVGRRLHLAASTVDVGDHWCGIALHQHVMVALASVLATIRFLGRRLGHLRAIVGVLALLECGLGSVCFRLLVSGQMELQLQHGALWCDREGI